MQRSRMTASGRLPSVIRQPTSDADEARRSLPDGVFGIVPGPSTTTFRGRKSTCGDYLVSNVVLDPAYLGCALPAEPFRPSPIQVITPYNLPA